MAKHEMPAGRSAGTTPRPRSEVALLDIWLFQIEPMFDNLDLGGYSVEARDGGIGRVDDASFQHGRGHLIVDTGPWIFGKKVMLPAGVIERVDPDTETVFVNRTKDEIKNAPKFEASQTGDADYKGRLGTYYGGADRR